MLITKCVESDSPKWKKALALEVIRSITDDHDFFLNIHKLSDTSVPKKMLTSIVNAINTTIETECRDPRTDFINYKYKMREWRRLESVTDTEIFHPETEEVLGCCIDCVSGIVSSLGVISGVSGGELSQSNEDILKITRNIVDITWGSILHTLEALLERCADEETVQAILRSYLLFTHICGTTGLATPRDAYLTSLCKYVYILIEILII